MTVFFRAVRSRDQADIRGTALEGHLSSAHCHLANISYRLGRSVAFEPVAERFVDDPEANALLRRTYRSGFEVPSLA